MAEYIIDKIEYGGNVYKLQDNVSDFLTGAVTSLSTTEGHHSTITNQNGVVSVAIPTNTSHLTNDSGFVRQFKVTVTESNGTFSADKTFTEIQTAYNQGYEVVCQAHNGDILPLISINESSGAMFEIAAMTVNGIPAGEIATISAEDEIAYNFISFTNTDEWDNKADIYDITSGVGIVENSSKLNIILGNHYAVKEGFMVYVSNTKTISTVQVRKTTNATSSQLEIPKSNVIINGVTGPSTISPGLYYGSLSDWSNSGTLTLVSAPTRTDLPVITFNGSTTNAPSFYAPTTAGTEGYFLKSNGSGAPVWTEVETTAVQIIRWGD